MAQIILARQYDEPCIDQTGMFFYIVTYDFFACTAPPPSLLEQLKTNIVNFWRPVNVVILTVCLVAFCKLT